MVETLHEKLVQGKVAVKTAAARPPVDDVGLDKLASAIELLANGETNETHKKLLLKTAEIIRNQQKRETWLVQELAQHMHKESASKFANELVARGICTKEELDAMVEKISKIGNLEAVKKAVEIVQPKRELPIGQVEKVASVKGQGDRFLEDPAIQYLMGFVGQ